MTLVHAYLALAAFLFFAGGLTFAGSPMLQSFRRSKFATGLLTLAAISWFSWWLVSLPEADLAGLPRLPVLIVFIGASLLSFKYMPDFLSVRSLGVLMLFLARHVLDVGYTHLPWSLLAAVVSYGVLVLFGFWWACSPPVFCRQYDWLLATRGRHRIAGGLLVLLAIGCLAQVAALP